MAGVVFGTEIFFAPTRLGHALERVPFLFTFAMKVLVYGTVIMLVVGGGLGWRVVAAAPVPLSSDLAAAISEHIKTPTAPRMARTFLLVGLGIFVLQMTRLVGERTLRDIVFGGYPARAPRSDPFCSSTSPDRRPSPSGSIIGATSINTSATRS